MGCKGMAGMRGGEALSRATESCQGMAEKRGEGGRYGLSLDVESCQIRAQVGERGGAVARCRGLPKGGQNEEERGCRKLSRAARK